MAKKNDSTVALAYEQYADWHEQAERRFLEPARLAAVRLINELLDTQVQEIDRNRFRVSSSRVKSPQRAYQKLSNEKYRERFSGYDAIPDVLDDLVGLRLICNNLSDIITLQEIFGELPTHDQTEHNLAVEKDSHRDYFADPKPSGYRAYHLNLIVPVPQAQESRLVRVEVQVRTLLQDGWGELTHEDTYKPGSVVPEWIVGMSLRMAELLAAVDNIAQDLRTGLDVETQRAVNETPSQNHTDVAYINTGEATLKIPTPGDTSESAPNAPAASAGSESYPSSMETILVDETRRLVANLTRPIPIALLSQQLTASFGSEITQVWAKFGGFKKLLTTAVPSAQVTGPAPGYIHPVGASIPPDYLAAATPDDVPDIVRNLRTYDKGLPVVSASRIQQAVDSVVAVVREIDKPSESGRVSLLQVEELAKLARARAESDDQLVLRPHAHYILQVVNRNGLMNSNISTDRVRELLLNGMIRNAERNGILDERKHPQELSVWLGVPKK